MAEAAFPRTRWRCSRPPTRPASSSGSSRPSSRSTTAAKEHGRPGREALGGSVEGKRIAVLGLAFKPNTDDMRDAPSIPLIEGLVARGAERLRLRSGGAGASGKLLPGDRIRRDADAAADGADALVIVTEWDEFRPSTLSDIAGGCAARCWSTCATSTTRRRPRKPGFDYVGIGRGARRRARV